LANYIGAIDQGTTSTRFIVFDRSGARRFRPPKKEHEQILSQNPDGWNTTRKKIWQRTREVIAEAMSNGKLQPKDLAAVGITNQRETTVVWKPQKPASRSQTPSYGKTRGSRTTSASWQKNRRAGSFSAARPGCRSQTYFSGLKNPLDSRKT